VAFALLVLANPANAMPRFANTFGNHMVLQREVPISLWGWTDPGEANLINREGLPASPFRTDD